MAYINDDEVLNLERVRANLRDNLRAQGVACEDDEGIDSLSEKVLKIQSGASIINKTFAGAITDNNVTSLEYGVFRDCTELTSASFGEVTTFVVENTVARTFSNCSKLTTVSIPKLTSVGQNAFYGCTSLTSASFPVATSVGGNAFSGCTSLTSASFPVATSVGGNAFSGCTSLTSASFPVATSVGVNAFFGCTSLRYVSLPRNTGNQLGSIYDNNLQVADLGQAQSFAGFSGGSSTYFDKLILRRENAITPLSATSVFNGTPFETGGGKLFTPTAQIPNYENGTNWSALGGLTVLSLIGSRFEDLDWFDNCNSTCTLEGNEIKVLDNETVAMFKHTENISHVYENGVELQDSDTVAGKTLTTSV